LHSHEFHDMREEDRVEALTQKFSFAHPFSGYERIKTRKFLKGDIISLNQSPKRGKLSNSKSVFIIYFLKSNVFSLFHFFNLIYNI
jgi:hypothetical protein